MSIFKIDSESQMNFMLFSYHVSSRKVLIAQQIIVLLLGDSDFDISSSSYPFWTQTWWKCQTGVRNLPFFFQKMNSVFVLLKTLTLLSRRFYSFLPILSIELYCKSLSKAVVKYRASIPNAELPEISETCN